jgi:hypothetical protein
VSTRKADIRAEKFGRGQDGQGLKPNNFQSFTPRLKSCPDTKPKHSIQIPLVENVVSHISQKRARYPEDSGAALSTNAMTAKEIPGIDPTLVSIIPMETDRIPANRSNRFRPSRGLIHPQQRRRLGLRLPRLTPTGSPFFMTSGTRASITQPAECPATLVAILPVDLHARTGGLLDPDPSRLSSLARQLVGLLRQLPGILFADKPYAFVTHPTLSILLPRLAL